MRSLSGVYLRCFFMSWKDLVVLRRERFSMTKKDAHRCKKYVIALRYTSGAAKMCGTHSCYHVEEGRRKDDVPYEKK